MKLNKYISSGDISELASSTLIYTCRYDKTTSFHHAFLLIFHHSLDNMA
jgi:hypothetical protein